MPMRNPFPEASLDFVRGSAGAACHRAKALQEQVDEANRVCQLWEDLATYVQKGWPRHVIAMMDSEKALFDRMRRDDDESLVRLDELYRVASSQIDELQRRFPAHMDEACTKANLPLDRTSRHPSYTFSDGFFQIRIDDRRGTARLSDYEGRLDEFPADLGAIVAAVERERKRVFGRPFDPRKFLTKLRHQYLAVTRTNNLQDGTSVPIRSITSRLGKNEKGFRTDEFLVDLSRLVETGPLEIEGYRLDLQHTKDTNQGMLLHGAAGRGYVGFVIFRRV